MKHEQLNERVTHPEAKGKSGKVVSHHAVRDNRGTLLRFTFNVQGSTSTPYCTANLYLWNKGAGGGWNQISDRSAEELRHIDASTTALDLEAIGKVRDAMMEEAGALLAAILTGDTFKPHRG